MLRRNKRQTTGRRNLPRWKKLVYGLLVAAMFLALLEGVLALAGIEPLTARRDPFVGFAAVLPHFEERAAIGEPPRMHTARNKLPYLNDQSFSIDKSSGVFRIFCLGGSTTYGQPYDDPTSFVGWLRSLLKAAEPAQGWEVVNAGGISYASYRVSALIEELVEYEPDLFVIYTGHNEFLEERTYRDVRSMSAVRSWSTVAAARTRIGAVIHDLFVSPPGAAAELSPDVETILDETVGPTSYQRDDELRNRIVTHFEISLRRMVDLARAAGAAVVFVRPACNLKDCSPFKSTPGDALSDDDRTNWQRHLEAARRLVDSGRHREAGEELHRALALDDRAAEVHYLLGQSLFAVGEYEQAESAFRRAIDEDVCPLRMTSDLGAALDRVVHDTGVLSVDFHRLLRDDSLRKSGHAVLGREYFLDHVHPTIEAHGMLAIELARRLWEADMLPGKGQLSQAAIDAATRQVHAQVDPLAHARAEAELARVLYWAGKQDEAGPLALKALATVEDDPRVWLIAGVYLHRVGRTDEALVHLRRAREMSPQDPRIRDALNSVAGRMEE